jgi:ketosteroid isomerase-like protein
MSENDDVRTVRRIYDAFVGGDLPAAVGLMAEDIELLPPVFAGVTAVPGWGRSWHGRREVEQYLTTLAETLEFEVFQPDEFVVAPENVVVLGHERCRVRATGHLVEADWAQLFTFRAGAVIRHREYSNTAAWEAGFGGARRAT